MYQRDITQDVTPAMADPSSAIRANQMSAEASGLRKAALGQVVEAAGTAYETKKFMDLRQLEADSEDLLQTFFTSNIAAGEAAVAANKLDTIAREEASVGPLRPEDVDAIDKIKAQAQRLRAASEGGMSRESYEARVAALSKQAIARYPGLANDIRNIVGGITGLAGAERWAASQFVNMMFSPQRGGGEDGISKLVEKDFTVIANQLGVSQEELSILYESNPAQYQQLRARAYEQAMIPVAIETAKNNMTSIAVQGDSAAPQLRSNAYAMQQATFAQKASQYYTAGVTEGLFNAYLEQVKQGKLDPAAFATEAQEFSTRMLRAAQEAHATARQAFRQKAIELGMSPTAIAENQKVLDDELADMERLWGDKNAFVASAMIEQNYANETFEKKYKMMQVHMQLLNSLPAQTINTYYMNPEGLRAQLPGVFDLINNAVQASERSSASVVQSLDVGRQRIPLYVDNAAKTGSTQMPADAPPEVARTVHEAVAAQAEVSVGEILKGAGASNEDVNKIKVMLGAATEVGATKTSIDRTINRIKQAVEKLSPEQRNQVLSATSESSVVGYNNVVNILNQANAAAGQTIFLGVNDAGQILPLGQGEPARSGVRVVSPALRDVKNKTGPILDNLVNVISALTGKDAKEVANELVTRINNGEPYPGFFSMEAKPVGPVMDGKMGETLFPEGSLRTERAALKAIGNVMDFEMSAEEKATLRSVYEKNLKRTDLTEQARRELQQELDALK